MENKELQDKVKSLEGSSSNNVAIMINIIIELKKGLNNIYAFAGCCFITATKYDTDFSLLWPRLNARPLPSPHSFYVFVVIIGKTLYCHNNLLLPTEILNTSLMIREELRISYQLSMHWTVNAGVDSGSLLSTNQSTSFLDIYGLCWKLVDDLVEAVSVSLSRTCCDISHTEEKLIQYSIVFF